MIMRITPGRIVAEYEGKKITIFIEALLPGQGSPNLLIFENSIAGWDPPYDEFEFRAEDKQKVVDGLKKDLEEKQITFEFE